MYKFRPQKFFKSYLPFLLKSLRWKHIPLKMSVAQSCLTLCNPVDRSLVHGILQARILEWVAILFSRGSLWPRDRTWSRFFTVWAAREAPSFLNGKQTCICWRCTQKVGRIWRSRGEGGSTWLKGDYKGRSGIGGDHEQSEWWDDLSDKGPDK